MTKPTSADNIAMLAPGRPNPQLRRDIVIAAGTEAIATQGFAQMSVSALARQIGMPASTVSQLFAGKQEILLEICERHLDHLLAAVEQADLPTVKTRRRLEALAIALLGATERHASAHRVLAIGLTHLPAPLQRDLWRKETWLATLFAAALEAVAPALAHRHVLTTTAASALLALLGSHERRPRDGSKRLSHAAYARFAVSSILGGVADALARARVRNGSR